MSTVCATSRRNFVAAALLGVGGGLLLPKQSAALAMPSDESPLLWFDPSREDACRIAAAAARRGSTTQAIVGDRVRFARKLLGGAGMPGILAGVTDYADFILLSGSAAEAGYRLIGERRYAGTAAAGFDDDVRVDGARGALVYWVAERRPVR